MDRIGHRPGMDPVALRRRNAYATGDVTPTGQTLRESVGAHAVLERTAARVGWAAKGRAYERANAAAAREERAGRFSRNGARPGGIEPSSTAAPARRGRRGIGLSLAPHGAGFTGSGEPRLRAPAAPGRQPARPPPALGPESASGPAPLAPVLRAR